MLPATNHAVRLGKHHLRHMIDAMLDESEALLRAAEKRQPQALRRDIWQFDSSKGGQAELKSSSLLTLIRTLSSAPAAGCRLSGAREQSHLHLHHFDCVSSFGHIVLPSKRKPPVELWSGFEAIDLHAAACQWGVMESHHGDQQLTHGSNQRNSCGQKAAVVRSR